MRKFLPVLLLVVAVGCAGPRPPVAVGPGLTGTYVVNGFDPAGVEYSGIVRITEGDAPDRLAFEWVITGAILDGVGTIRGSTVDVEWRAVDPVRSGGATGTATYTITDDGHLMGTRTVDGTDGVGTEEIFPQP